MTHSMYIKTKNYSKCKIVYEIHSHYIKFDIQETTNDTWKTVIKGSIKWDGCSNFKYKDTTHYCGFAEAQHWLDILHCCYYICEQEMPGWDSLGEESSWPEGYKRHDA